MRDLTKRERVLIHIAVLLLVIYTGGILLDLPAVARYKESKAALWQIENEWLELNEDLAHLNEVRRMYEEKIAELKPGINCYYDVATETELEKYVLSCLDRAGLIPIRTYMDGGEESENLIHTGAIEVETEGSRSASMIVLDYLKENPILTVDAYSLYPIIVTRGKVWKMQIRLVYQIPALWNDAQILISKGG